MADSSSHIPLNPRPTQILLVEDNPADVRLTQEALKETKVLNAMHVVSDGEEALAFLFRQGRYAEAPRPDLVILDLNLPKKDGWQVLAEIRADETLKSIPVVVLTVSPTEEDILRNHNLNANCYITKPIDLDQFIKVVKAIDSFWMNIVTLPDISSQTPLYGIGRVGEMTGVPATTLRFWENRYGLICPKRSDGRHRLYSQDDVEHIKWLKKKIETEGLRTREAHLLLSRLLERQGEPSNKRQSTKRSVMMLVAEKDAVTVQLEQYFLTQEGLDVFVILNGLEAVEQAQKRQPDFAILDIIIPGLNGIAVCHTLKANRKTAHIPVVIFSTLDAHERALAAGADAFLHKPVEQAKLIDTVKKSLLTTARSR
jgi:CheY-like chemotaxis protein